MNYYFSSQKLLSPKKQSRAVLPKVVLTQCLRRGDKYYYCDLLRSRGGRRTLRVSQVGEHSQSLVASLPVEAGLPDAEVVGQLVTDSVFEN
jgi:hypothetical protein